MPEPLGDYESRMWDAMYGDVKFLVLQYKLRDSWTTKEAAQEAFVQLLQYHGKAGTDYWRFIRTLRLMSLTSRLLKTELPDDVRKVVRRTDKALFLKNYQPYLAKFWNWQFLTKRQQAKKGSNTPYKRWNWLATQEELKSLAANRPNTFRYVLAFYEQQAKDMRPVKSASLTRLLRLMRDVAFDLEAA